MTIGHAEQARPFFVFQKMDDQNPGLNRVHADVITSDLSAELERILALGATVIREVKEEGIHFYTLADLEGNNFDLAAE